MKTTALVTLAAPVSWGTTYVVVAEFLPAERPLLVAVLRMFPAAVALLLVTLWRTRWRPHGVEWRWTTLLAACNFGVFFPLLIVAVHRLPGGVAAAVGGVQPLLVGVLLRILGGVRPSRLDVAVGAVATFGVAAIVLRPGAGIDAVGVAAALGANVSFAGGVVLTKLRPAPSDRIGSTGWQLAIGALMVAPVMLLVEGAPPALTAREVAGVTHLALIGTALAFVLWFRGIEKLPAVAPPLLGLAAPVTGATLGWLVRGEDLTTVQLLGFALTIAAIAYGTLARPQAGAQVIGTYDPQADACTMTTWRSASTGPTVTAVPSSVEGGGPCSSTARTTCVTATVS